MEQGRQGQGRRGRDKRCGEQVAESPGDHRGEEGGVEHQHGARHRGHAAHHHRKQFTPLQGQQVGPDQQRRLHHAEKDIGGGADTQGPADTEAATEHPGKPPHHHRQDAPVKQQRRKGTHHQHQGQAAKGENIAVLRAAEVEGGGAATEVAEHQAGAGAGGFLQGQHQAVEHREEALRLGQFDQQQGDKHLQDNAANHHPDRRPAALAAQPAQQQEQGEAEGALQLRGHGDDASGGVGGV